MVKRWVEDFFQDLMTRPVQVGGRGGVPLYRYIISYIELVTGVKAKDGSIQGGCSTNSFSSPYGYYRVYILKDKLVLLDLINGYVVDYYSVVDLYKTDLACFVFTCIMKINPHSRINEPMLNQFIEICSTCTSSSYNFNFRGSQYFCVGVDGDFYSIPRLYKKGYHGKHTNYLVLDIMNIHNNMILNLSQMVQLVNSGNSVQILQFA